MLTIQNDRSRHMSKLYGVERTQPITPITSTPSSFNVFDASMSNRMNVTAERRDPVVPAEGRHAHSTFGDRHRSHHRKGNRQSPPTQSSSKSLDRSGNKPISRGKINPYVKPPPPNHPANHPLMMEVSSASSMTSTSETHGGGGGGNQFKTESIEYSSMKPSKRHKKNRNDYSSSVQPSSKGAESLSVSSQSVAEGKEGTTLGSIGKSSSFTAIKIGPTSPSNSEKGFSHSTKAKMFKRSNSADTPAHPQQVLDPVRPVHATGHTSFSCYDSTTVEKKKDRKTKKNKKDKEQEKMDVAGPKHKSASRDGHVTHSSSHVTHSSSHVAHPSSHVTPVSIADTKIHPSKPSKLKYAPRLFVLYAHVILVGCDGTVCMFV